MSALVYCVCFWCAVFVFFVFRVLVVVGVVWCLVVLLYKWMVDVRLRLKKRVWCVKSIV